MPLQLTKTEILCPQHGENIWRVSKNIVDVNGKATTQDIDRICQRCEPKKFIEMLRNTEKINKETSTDVNGVSAKRNY